MKRNKIKASPSAASIDAKVQRQDLPMFEFDIQDIPVEPAGGVLPKTVLPPEMLAPYVVPQSDKKAL